MTKVMTHKEFFEAVEAEGGFEALALAEGGTIVVDGDAELTNSYKEFVEFLDILEDHYAVWNAESYDLLDYDETEEGE